jgi:DNA-directed RNA polymerase I, II, and III subunit RPABC1
MTSTFQSLPIEKTLDEQRFIVAINIIKMLIERGVINGVSLAQEMIDIANLTNSSGNIDDIKNHSRNSNVEELARKLVDSFKDDGSSQITVDNPQPNDSKVYKIVYLFDQKITTTAKTSVIGDYLYKNTSEHKIIIVDSIQNKTRLTIQKDFPMVEVFIRDEMMFCLVEHMYQPLFQLLSPAEAEKIMTEYQLKKREFPRMFFSDPISRYYKASIGQIFKIYRPSETSGVAVYYRIVIQDIALKK